MTRRGTRAQSLLIRDPHARGQGRARTRLYCSSALASGALRGLVLAAGLAPFLGVSPAAAQCASGDGSGAGAMLTASSCNATTYPGFTESVAVGQGANASGLYATVVGASAYADGYQTAAFGYLANAVGADASAIGFHANANGTAASAVGSQSTARGEVALDGAGLDSPFVRALLETLATPNQPFQTVVQDTTAGVIKKTNGQQKPTAYGIPPSVALLPPAAVE